MPMALRSFTAKKYRRSNAPRLLTYLLLHPLRSEQPMPHLGIPYSGQWIPHSHKGPGCQDCKTHQIKSNNNQHFVSADLCVSTVAFPSLFSSPFKQFAMLLQGAEAHTSLCRSSLEYNKSILNLVYVSV